MKNKKFLTIIIAIFVLLIGTYFLNGFSRLGICRPGTMSFDSEFEGRKLCFKVCEKGDEGVFVDWHPKADYECYPPASDAGKVCKRSSECEYVCEYLPEDGYYDYEKMKEITDPTGQCSKTPTIHGATTYITEDGTLETIAIN